MNQKEYLKKYLKIGKHNEKKKKKRQKNTSGLKIIDDDIYTVLSPEIHDDIDAGNEDAPQIVAVIDERPPSMRVDEKTKSNLWQPIGQQSTNTLEFQNLKKLTVKSNKNKGHTEISGTFEDNFSNKHSVEIENDSSPVRKKKINGDLSTSTQENKQLPKFQNKLANIQIDICPQKTHIDSRKYQDDLSELEHQNQNDNNYIRKHTNSLKHDKDSKTRDISPPRKKITTYKDSKTRELDISPPRKKNTYKDSKARKLDMSPSRIKITTLKEVKKSDQESPRLTNTTVAYKNSKTRELDISPPRKKSKYKDSKTKELDMSPTRKKIATLKEVRKSDQESPGLSNTTIESDAKYSSERDKRNKKSRWEQEEKTNILETTMNEKKFGLQSAQNLANNNAYSQEAEILKMSADLSGANKATLTRRKYEEIKDPHKETREKELKEKYSVWGQGVKQVQDESERLNEQKREMNKPLARYADDEDLEQYLKEQERDGDPMLAYIKKKKKMKVAIENNIPEKPMYNGDYMPNRFGIRPGYRWDGVFRSNGYEKQWFEMQNSRKAMVEEALKWSTEDM